jgi:4-methylaminobutanoate oxidase (formaldehyde-forming)
VTRWGPEEFLVVTGTAFGGHDLAWLRTRLTAPGSPADPARVQLTDVTGQYVTFGLWGPRARDILARCTPGGATAVREQAFGFMTARELTVGNVPVRAVRVTFVGEAGWELSASTEYGMALWQSLWDAGQPDGLAPCGYRAIESLRLEKGYRVWGSDITPETTPEEAGLSFAVKLDHPARPDGFHGRDAVRAARGEGQGRTAGRCLACIVLDRPEGGGQEEHEANDQHRARPRVVLGSEPVRLRSTGSAQAGAVLGRVTSGGYGYTVDASIAYAYLPAEHAGTGTAVEIDLFGDWVPGTVTDAPLYDPKGERLRTEAPRTLPRRGRGS